MGRKGVRRKFVGLRGWWVPEKHPCAFFRRLSLMQEWGRKTNALLTQLGWFYLEKEGTCIQISRGMQTHAQSCLILCNPIDCSPPGSSVHGDSPATTVEWVAIFSSTKFHQSPQKPRINVIPKDNAILMPLHRFTWVAKKFGKVLDSLLKISEAQTRVTQTVNTYMPRWSWKELRESWMWRVPSSGTRMTQQPPAAPVTADQVVR